jgi:hypothetical protein
MWELCWYVGMICENYIGILVLCWYVGMLVCCYVDIILFYDYVVLYVHMINSERYSKFKLYSTTP